MDNIEFQKENLSISEAVFYEAQRNQSRTAITYMGRKISYKTFIRKIKLLSIALYSLGVKRGEVVLVALPNIPQAVYLLYALNRIGAVPAFVSPVSAEYELEDYIKKCKSQVIIALESLYGKLINVFNRTGDKKIVLTSALDELWVPYIRKKENAILWSELIKNKSGRNIYLSPLKPDDTAVILFSGGTTGKPKAVELTNLNLNALAGGTGEVCGDEVKNVKMLSVLPVFHGFGLGICVHTVLYFGGECILIPRFDADKVGKNIRIYKPQYIAAVPAMLNALMQSKSLVKGDLSFLLGVFSGGDSLSVTLEKKFNKFLLNHKAKINIRQGYGLTECVAASCLMPSDGNKSESIGKPYPDVLYKIVKVNTCDEVKKGTAGEICISGKTVMKGYFNDKEETEKVLKTHDDGRLWLHTGDMGCIDKEGYVFFKSRYKRIIVTNGNNVYPSEIERVLLNHKDVKECCAVGVNDKNRNQRVAVFAVISGCCDDNIKKQAELFDYLSMFLSKQTMPKNIFFIDKLPRTSMGKVACSELIEIAESKENTAE